MPDLYKFYVGTWNIGSTVEETFDLEELVPGWEDFNDAERMRELGVVFEEWVWDNIEAYWDRVGDK